MKKDDFFEPTQEYAYHAKNDVVWLSQPPNHRRMLAHNIQRSEKAGPTQQTKGLDSLSTFSMLMSREICDIIIHEINAKAKICFERERAAHPEKQHHGILYRPRNSIHT